MLEKSDTLFVTPSLPRAVIIVSVKATGVCRWLQRQSGRRRLRISRLRPRHRCRWCHHAPASTPRHLHHWPPPPGHWRRHSTDDDDDGCPTTASDVTSRAAAAAGSGSAAAYHPDNSVISPKLHYQSSSDLVVSALGIRTQGPRFESRVAPLFHWVATLGKLFTHIASPVSQLQETVVQKKVFGP